MIHKLTCIKTDSDDGNRRCNNNIFTFTNGIYICPNHNNTLRVNLRHTIIHDIGDTNLYKCKKLCNSYFSSGHYRHQIYLKVMNKVLYRNLMNFNRDIIAYILNFV